MTVMPAIFQTYRQAPIRAAIAAIALCFSALSGAPCLIAQVASPNAAVAPPIKEHQDEVVQELVADLGAKEYSKREAASEELIRRGSAIAPYVRRAAESPNLEVNTRAQRILAIISRQTFEEAIEAFLADEGGQRGATLPGWERARPRLDGAPDPRRLFADMYRAEPALMAAYGENEAAAESSLSLRVDELYDQNTQRNQGNYNFRNQLQNAISVNVMAILFVGADRRLDVATMSATKFKMLFMQSWPAQRIAFATERDQLRDWLGEWIVRRFDQPQREHEGITLGMTYDVPRTVELAKRVLERGESESYVHMYAALCIGKYGQDWHLPLVERLLENETVVQTRQKRVENQMVQFQTQLRDVALLVLVHRTGQSPHDYGFEEIDRHADYLFLPHSVAFERTQFRDAALAKWHGWRGQHALFEGEPPRPDERRADEEEADEAPAEDPEAPSSPRRPRREATRLTPRGTGELTPLEPEAQRVEPREGMPPEPGR
jgi:hypothetical protein